MINSEKEGADGFQLSAHVEASSHSAKDSIMPAASGSLYHCDSPTGLQLSTRLGNRQVTLLIEGVNTRVLHTPVRFSRGFSYL